MAVARGIDRVVILTYLLCQVLSAASRPNVLFLVVDDLRPKLNCYGQTNMVTPNLDQLAANSLRFDRAYVQQALCSPSRTSFLTGRRPDTTRTFDLHVYFRHLAGNYTTLPQHFKDNGYITQSVGKIFHPGPTSGNTDDFPYSWTFPARHAPTRKYLNDKICLGPEGKLYNNAVCPLTPEEIPDGELPDAQNADFAIEFLHNRTVDKKPFFLALGFHKPHLPFRYPAKYKDLYPLSRIHLADNQDVPLMMPDVAYSPWDWLRHFDDIQGLNISWPYGAVPKHYQYLLRQSYSAAVSFTDSQVGRVLQALDQSGFANNTIVTFHGDHGWLLGELHEWTKHTNFDLALRIPLLFYVPGVTSTKSTPGKTFPFQDALTQGLTKERHSSTEPDSLTTDALVEAVDIYATLAELAGLPVPPTCPPDPFNVTFCTEGASFAPLIHKIAKTSSRPTDVTGDKWKTAVFSQYPRPAFHPVKDNTMSPSLNGIHIMGYTMRTDQRRYTEWVAYQPLTFFANFSHVFARELYDYQADPEGNYNLADVPAYSKVVQQLALQLRAGWRKALPGNSTSKTTAFETTLYHQKKPLS